MTILQNPTTNYTIFDNSTIQAVKIFNETFFPNPEYVNLTTLVQIYSYSNDITNSLETLFPKITELVEKEGLSISKPSIEIYEDLGVIKPKISKIFANGKSYNPNNSEHRRKVNEAIDRGEEPLIEIKQYPKEHLVIVLILYYMSTRLKEEREITVGTITPVNTPKYFVKDCLIRNYNKKIINPENKEIYVLPNKFRAAELAAEWLTTMIGRFMQIKIHVEAKKYGMNDENIAYLQQFFEDILPKEEKRIIKTNEGIYIASANTDKVIKQGSAAQKLII